jgi:hypothetical protein
MQMHLYAKLFLAVQLEDNLKAIEIVPKLTSEIMEKIEGIIKSLLQHMVARA